MTGLLLKDWKLFRRQGRYYGFVLILACAMAFIGSKDFSSFITSYMTFMIAIFSFSSFTYDEYEDGMAFLMALPSGRRDSVKAKYVFSLLLITGGWIMAVILRFGFFLIRYSAAEYLEILPVEPVYLLMTLLYVECSFPVLMKFGAEKGRSIAFGGLAVIGAGVFLLAKSGIILPVFSSIDRLAETAPVPLLAGFLTVCAVILWISYRVSLRFMEKREF